VADLLLVVDFDGTVYRGDELTRFFACRLAAALPNTQAEALLDSFECYLAKGVRAAQSCDDMVEAAALREAADGYGAATALARRVYGVSREVIEEAFIASRTYMVESRCPLEPVEELIDTLRGLRSRARIVLATNSPRTGLDEVLGRLGASGVFDDLACGLGKPDGLRRYLRGELGVDLRARPWRLFALGDIHRNDIAPAVEVGAGAGYIDRFGRADGAATAAAPTAEALLPALAAWADDPRRAAEAVRTHPN
jgi:FMN phosphatase YigB (HAD superfamily)